MEKNNRHIIKHSMAEEFNSNGLRSTYIEDNGKYYSFSASQIVKYETYY